MPSTAETDAEDVNDFLKRIQELGTKRDQEDEERNKKLEEEILQGRKERQARRAERARSISPIKDSPANTPPPYKSAAVEPHTQSPNLAFTPSRELQPLSQSSNRHQLLDETMGRLTGENSPIKENASSSATDRSSCFPEKDPSYPGPIRASPLSPMLPRSPTLSWQRRPNLQTMDPPKKRSLPMIASESATPTRSSGGILEPSSEERAPIGRNEIAQSLLAKDPTWFRQTSDRGQNSAAYRKTQVEDKDVGELVSNTSRVQLPGMSRTPSHEYGDAFNFAETKQKGMDGPSSPSKTSSSKDSVAVSDADALTTGRTGFVSPMPAISAQLFAQPGSTTLSDGNRSPSISTRNLAMSPSQGRISPERLDRPISPTKGMGGFVQSAMMKRSDSVSKRWSVHSPGGLTRGDSVANNRSSQDLASRIPLSNILNSTTREPRPSSLSRENTPLSTSRPGSSHSNATVGLADDRHDSSSFQWGTMSEVTLDGEFIRPGLPASQLKAPSDANSGRQLDQPESSSRSETPPLQSPSKVIDTRRWSPTKASWLESALNKPESPKPKQVPPPQQPSWMSEISKAKQKVPAPETSKPPGHKHQVNIGGLLKSPPMGGLAKPLTIGGLPTGFSSGSFTINQPKASAVTPKTAAVNNCDAPENAPIKALGEATFQRSETPKSATSLGVSSSSPVTSKAKPETPPKKDFRSNLKSKQLSSSADDKEEPEFKNVFGQLRRAKTQNYVAPDELKENILRGKAGLNFTGGPKKTERRDEFKEAILKKKEDFKKAQLEGTGVAKSTATPIQAQLPEALLKKASLGRANTAVPVTLENDVFCKDLSDIPSRNCLPSNLAKQRLLPEASTPTETQMKLDQGSKLAGRFNPGLAGILARGPPPNPTAPSTKVDLNLESSSRRLEVKGTGQLDSGPQLTHVTKGRARGPRRKAPSAISPTAPQIKAVTPP